MAGALKDNPQFVAAAKTTSALLLLVDQYELERGKTAPTAEIEAEYEKQVGPLVAAAQAAEEAVIEFVIDVNGLGNIKLHKKRPFSDESLSDALSELIGYRVRSIKDRQILKQDAWAAASGVLSEQTGVTFSDLSNKSQTKRDLLNALARLAERNVPGLELGDVSNPEQVREKIWRFATLKISDMTGCNFRDLRNREYVKEDLMEFIEADVRALLEAESSGYKNPLKMDEKSVRNRWYQKKFVERHGARARYVKLEDD